MEQERLGEIGVRHVAAPAVYPAGRFAGRGIVICAGGPRYFTCAFVTLHILRHALGCTLPVQIWHLGQREMSPAMRRILAAEGAEIIDAAPLLARYPAVIRNGWALKPFAVAHARFAEVISLDADAIPLRDPAEIFAWPEYQAQGALFWPDIVDIAEENPVWAALGLPARREIGFETGLFAVDKARNWAMLELTIALNNASGELYRMIYGEKDSFLLSYLLRGQDFTLLARRPLLFDSDLIQLDPAGEPFLHHRTHSKFLLEGPNRPVYGGALNDAAEAARLALRREWTGTVFHPPANLASADILQGLTGTDWLYQTSAAGARILRLGADFQVAAGRAEFEQHWAAVLRAGAPVLQFFSRSRLAVELLPQADGSWRGISTVTPHFAAQLVPAAAAATMPFAGPERVFYPSGAMVAALLRGAAPQAGFDAAAAAQLAAGLALLNGGQDDVPEALQAWLDQHRLAPEWQDRLAALVVDLRAARDSRLAALVPEAAPMDVLRPGFYERVT